MTRFPRSAPAMIIASGVVALTLAVGGGAVAGSLITSAQIQDDSVRSVDVKDGTLKIKDISTKAKKALSGQDGATGVQGPAGADGQDGVDGATGPQGPAGKDGQDGATGPQGPAGTPGWAGPAGADGVDGVSGYEIVQKVLADRALPYSGTVQVDCPVGKRALGAGYAVALYSPASFVHAGSAPITSQPLVSYDENGPSRGVWISTFDQPAVDGATKASITLWATCATMAP